MRIHKIILMAAITALLSTAPAFAALIQVPTEDFPSIQSGIDAAEDGDTVLVAPDLYSENINFRGKNIVLIGDPDNPMNVSINGENSGAVVMFVDGEEEGAVLNGFYLHNGREERDSRGGGIKCNSSPTLLNLIIARCYGSRGGGISFIGGSATLSKTVIKDNIGGTDGGGIYIQDSNPTIEGVIVTGNRAGRDGAGVMLVNARGTIKNSIVWDNDGAEFAGNGEFTVSYSDVQGREDDFGNVNFGEGNINADPRFVDIENGDFRLTANSPCIDTGDPDSPEDPDGTRADMGAFYYHQEQDDDEDNDLQEFKITADDAADSDRFGWSVSISGDYAIIGANLNDDDGENSGSAYIFVRNGNDWVQQAKLTANDAAAGDYFGESVSISGDYAIVGAWGDDDGGQVSGSAYIFHRDGGNWTLYVVRIFGTHLPNC